MNNKRYDASRLGNSKGFRSFVPGAGDEEQIFLISLYFELEKLILVPLKVGNSGRVSQIHHLHQAPIPMAAG